MRKQPPEAIISYLKRLDRCLTRPVELEVIGGTAKRVAAVMGRQFQEFKAQCLSSEGDIDRRAA